MAKTFSIQNILEDLQLASSDLPGDLSHLAEFMERMVPGRGMEITLALAEEYRSTYIHFHNVDNFWRRLRNVWIIERYGNGEKVSKIARDVRLSERQIWDILGKEPAEEKQLRLFE